MVERGPEGREGAAGREGVPGREGVRGAKGEQGKRGSIVVLGSKAFLAVVGVFVLTLCVFVYFIRQNRQLAREGSASHRAHCIQRAALDLEIRKAADFLKENPQPVILTLPRELFETALAEDRETRRLLAVLDCSDVDVRPPVRPEPAATP